MLTRAGRLTMMLALMGGFQCAGAAGKMEIPPAPRSSGMTTDLNLFLQLDVDRDGRVTRTEAGRSATVRGDFDRIDRDRDGFLSRDEWVQYSTQTPAVR